MILVEIDQHEGRRDGFEASQLTFRRIFRPSRSLKAQQLCERLVPRDVALQNLVESKDGEVITVLALPDVQSSNAGGS